ncbi:MAG: hypothetical protein KDK28_17375, partial [Maritimibacter sp.]|nr:hypothetical protein [Maritimibacter sp.]
VGIGINVARGRTTIECGCGGAPQAVGPALLWRNGILATAALVAAALPSGGLPVASVVAALAAGILLWVAFLMADLLLSNASLARRSL